MIDFEWAWAFLILPLPWLSRRLLPPAGAETEAVLRVPFIDDFAVTEGAHRRSADKKWTLGIASLAWFLLVTAVARPQWVGAAVEQAVGGRDLMLAVDLSGSMQEEDFVLESRRVDRLQATKVIAGEFIERRVGDRVGLILFGDRAYLQAPLTFDRQTVRVLLDESVIGLAGEKTAIGDAIGLAVKRLRGARTDSRVLILLTDGANTAGEVSPLKAADLAASEGLKIYTIGIGADEMVVRGFFGTRRINPSQDLDEETLSAIAGRTGGRYFRARDAEELDEIYRLLDHLEPVVRDDRFFRPKKALYPWPLGAAVLLTGLLFIVRLREGGRS